LILLYRLGRLFPNPRPLCKNCASPSSELSRTHVSDCLNLRGSLSPHFDLSPAEDHRLPLDIAIDMLPPTPFYPSDGFTQWVSVLRALNRVWLLCLGYELIVSPAPQSISSAFLDLELP
jgi:hypothetical protein